MTFAVIGWFAHPFAELYVEFSTLDNALAFANTYSRYFGSYRAYPNVDITVFAGDTQVYRVLT